MSYDVELLKITKNNMAEAQFIAANFINKKLQNRVFFNAIAAESVINYLGELGIDISNLSNIHSIKRIVEKIDISDIILSNIHIDVRVAFDKSGVFIPKSHFELSIVPDIYTVLKYDNNFEKINLIGFFNPSEVQLHDANEEYYFVNTEQFKSSFEMLDFINSYDGSPEKNISQEEMLKGRELSVKVADHDISDTEFKYFMQLLVKSSTLRASVLEYDNFETLASNVAVALRINKNEQNTMQNSVVDFEDFIDMDESNDANSSDTENETAEDFNGDSMLEDEAPNELTVNNGDIEQDNKNENNNDIDGIIKTAGAIGATGLGIAAAGAQEIAEGTATGEAIELAALAGDTICNQDLNNENSQIEINKNTENNTDNSQDLFESDTNNNITENYEEPELSNSGENVNENTRIDFEDNNNEIKQTENQDLDIKLSDIDINEEVQLPTEIGLPENFNESDTPEEFDINEDTDSDFSDFEKDMELQATDDFIEDDSETNPNDPNINDDITEEALTDEDQNINDLTDISIDKDLQIEENNFEDIFEDESISVDFEQENNSETNHDGQMSKLTDDTNPTEENNIENKEEENLLPDDSIQDKFINNDFPEEKTQDDLTIDLDQDNNLLIDLEELENNTDSNGTNKPIETEQDENVISLNEIEESELSNKNTKADAEELNYQKDKTPSPENVLDFDQIPSEAVEPKEEDVNYELINLSDIGENTSEDTTNAEVSFNNNETTEFEDIPLSFENSETNFASIDDFDLNPAEIAPINTVKENSAIITDKNQNPGEILIDINKNNSEPYFSLENQHLEELYNNENVLNEKSGLDNDVRIVNEKGKSVPVVALAGGLTVFIILAGLIIFSIAKFMTPQQNTNNEMTENMDIQDNMGGNVPEINVNNNGNIAMNNPNQDFERRRNNPQQKPAIQQNQDNLKQIPDTAFMSVRKLSWEVPDYISFDSNFKQYFQSAGKSLKAALSSDLLLATDYAYSDQIRVSVTFDRSGALKNTKLLLSSGSSQVDNIVLQSVNQTLKVLKAPNSVGNDESTTVILKIYL